MAFEDYCIRQGAEGRLIPLPKEISAGCGLAWSAPPADREHVEELLRAAVPILEKTEAAMEAQKTLPDS